MTFRPRTIQLFFLLVCVCAAVCSQAQPRADSRSFGHLWTLYDGIRQNFVRDQRAMLDTIQWKAEAEHDAYQLFIVNHKRLLLGRQQQDLSLQDAVLWLDSLRRDNVAARWGDPDSAIYHSLYHYLTGLLLATNRPSNPQTMTIRPATFQNMEDWSGENFNEEAKKQYASCFACLPKAIPLHTHRWDFLLVTIPETRPLRPTLNDVLYQSCISLFGEDDPEFAGALVDEAMAAHTERNILVDYEIQRLHFIFPHVQENVDSSASWRKLDSLEQKYGADVAFDYERGLQLAVAYQLMEQETDYMARAIEYFDKVLRQCGTDESGNPLLAHYEKNAAYYLDMLTRPRLALGDAHIDLPLGHKLRIPIQYSNLETLYVSVYPVPDDIVPYRSYEKKVVKREIASFSNWFEWNKWLDKKICTQRFDLDAAGHFATTELWMDSLPVGNYRFFFHTKPELDEAGVLMEADFRVTRLKLSTWSVMNKRGYISVNDRRTGEPLPGKWGWGGSMFLFPRLSNRFGEIRYARSLGYREPCSVYDKKVSYSTLDWERIDMFSFFHHHGYSSRAQLFTDRTLYRPGQSVYFKYILSKKGRALKNVPVMAILFGNKSATPDTLRLTTSQYGSVSGEFQLPKVVGEYRLEVFPVSNKKKKNQRRYFSFAERKQIEVAEYKLPTFKVRLESDSQQVAAGDTFTIRGKVTALNGVPVRNAAVVLNVKTNFTAKQERLDVVTEQDGRFAYRYPVTRNTYRLDVEAIVTDINGETHSDKSMVMISQDLLTIHLSDDKDVDLALDDTARWRVTAVNYCDIVQNVPLRITVVRLDAPKEYRIPAFDKTPAYWRPLHSEEEYAREFPHLTFNLHANDAAYWPAMDTCFRVVKTSSLDSLLEIVVKDWNVGNYKMLVETTDKAGNAVSKTLFFTINNSARTDFQAFQPIRAEFVSIPQKKGQPLKISVGSSLEKAMMLCDVYQGKRRLKTWRIPLSREQKTVKVRTHSSGNRELSLCARIVQDGQLHSVVRDTFVEMDNSTQRKLLRRYNKLVMNAELTHYRNVSEPGSNEHWEMTLTDAKGKTMRQAELLAWMIDGSLHELGMRKTDYGAYYYPKRVRIPDYLNVKGSQIKCRDISNSYTNYYCHKENKTPKSRLYYESVIRPMQDFYYLYYSSHSVESQSVVIKYEPPMFDADNTASESDVARVLANMAGVSSVDGQMASVRGNRSEGTRVIVDGVRVRNDSPGLAFPQPAVAEPAAPKPSLAPEVKVRSHFMETAFFYPSLHPDDSGRVHIRFTLPDQYTGWEFYAFGHSKDMRTSRMRALLQSRRTLMLQSNAPRFFREGDTLILRTKITNCGEESQEGNVMLEFFNAEDNHPVEMIFDAGDVSAKGTVTFHVAAGTSEVVQFRIRVPEGVPAVSYRMMARTGSYGDGEENILPVLPNKMLVTEARSFTVPAGQDAAFTFQHYRTHTTPTMQPLNYTLEVTTNPAWLAIRALPYLMRYPYECNEQIFSKIFAAATVQHMLAQTPALREVFDSWLNDTVNEALASPLLKNVSLQSMLLEETPWLHDAQSESHQRQETAKLFADENLQRQLEKNINKLLHNQLVNGGWDWYGKSYYSRYITNHIVSGFYKLRRLGVEIPQADKMLGKAIHRSDVEQEDRYQAYLKRKEKDSKAQFFFSEEDVHYLYARSFAPYDAAWLSMPFVRNLMTLMTKDLRNAPYTRQAEVALILYRTGREADAKEIMEYIRQQAVTDREKGMYWRKEFDGNFYRWYEAPIERQALLIEAFTEIAPCADELTAMKHWLLCQKRGNSWPSTKATSEAVYALLLDAPANLLRPSTTVVTVGGETLKPAEDAHAEAGTGFQRRVWHQREMTPELADIRVRADGVHPAFGACYWQYLEVPDQVEAAGSGLTVRRTLYHQPAAGDGRTAGPVTDDNPVRLGERITVRVVVTSDRDLEYVQVKDPRASAFEPVNIHERSGRQNEVWWVESPRDASTNFFFSRFPQGTVVLEYDVFATQTGDFSSGATTVECMYAPEYRAQFAGTRIRVVGK